MTAKGLGPMGDRWSAQQLPPRRRRGDFQAGGEAGSHQGRIGLTRLPILS